MASCGETLWFLPDFVEIVREEALEDTDDEQSAAVGDAGVGGGVIIEPTADIVTLPEVDGSIAATEFTGAWYSATNSGGAGAIILQKKNSIFRQSFNYLTVTGIALKFRAKNSFFIKINSKLGATRIFSTELRKNKSAENQNVPQAAFFSY